MPEQLLAGSAVADITPSGSVFLFGYPNVPRWSTGVHDPLLASALHISDGATAALFVAIDIIFVTRSSTQRIRERITAATGVPGANILISATHTHSGPMTVDYLANEHDSAVPRTDAKYLQWFEDQVVAAAVRAVGAAEPARIGLVVGDAAGVGTNRRDPGGPADHSLPVLFVQRRADHSPLAIMLICSMHPTVLHEDSTLISGDFPGLARRYLQSRVVGAECPILYHTGPAGNQSPRHVVQSNTLSETERLGGIIGSAAERALSSVSFVDRVRVECRSKEVHLPVREFASLADAERALRDSFMRLEGLRRANAARAEVRTAECDWFGAAETVTLARAAADGRLADVVRSCMPAEVQLIRLNDWNFVGWPGELFVEFALQVKAQRPNTFIINYANGELQGYLVTQQAVDEGGYEASNALFRSPEGGDAIVRATVELLK